MFKSGFVTIIGNPNVGKSTLLNKILGEKIAIVSSKPQTTRTKIMGVHTDSNAQIIFIDTPGMHSPRNKLGEIMVRTAKEEAAGADIIYVMTDCTNPSELPDIPGGHKFLVINKVDGIEKEKILPIIAEYGSEFDEVFPISAKTGEGVDALLEATKKYLAEGPKYYPDDTMTDQPERVIASEMIREKVFRLLNEEVPFGTAVGIEKFEEKEKLTSIEAIIYCEKESHKGIIIGKNGDMIKKIGSSARVELEKFLGVKVFLNVWVKVSEGWRDSGAKLRNFGYTFES